MCIHSWKGTYARLVATSVPVGRWQRNAPYRTADVYPEEAEQVFYNGAHVRRAGSGYYAYGQDDTGRYLFLAFELRRGAIGVFSARDMTVDERRLYRRHRR